VSDRELLELAAKVAKAATAAREERVLATMAAKEATAREAAWAALTDQYARAAAEIGRNMT
jgi:hypothetical protein